MLYGDYEVFDHSWRVGEESRGNNDSITSIYNIIPAVCVKTRICTSSVLVTSIFGFTLQIMFGRIHTIHFTSTMILKKNIHMQMIV